MALADMGNIVLCIAAVICLEVAKIPIVPHLQLLRQNRADFTWEQIYGEDRTQQSWHLLTEL